MTPENFRKLEVFRGCRSGTLFKVEHLKMGKSQNIWYRLVTTYLSLLILSLKGDFPKGTVFLRFEKLNLDIWESILFRLLMRVHILLMNKVHRERKWVKDAIPIPQSQCGFNVYWKLCLNLCSRRLFRPRCSLVTHFYSYDIWQL